jgi:protein FAM50
VCFCAAIFFVLQEWLAQQEAVKNEPLEIVYSYWDGSGHRRKVRWHARQQTARYTVHLQQGVQAVR